MYCFVGGNAGYLINQTFGGPLVRALRTRAGGNGASKCTNGGDDGQAGVSNSEPAAKHCTPRHRAPQHRNSRGKNDRVRVRLQGSLDDLSFQLGFQL